MTRPSAQAALDGVGQRLAGRLVDDVEDPGHRLAAGLGDGPAGQPLGDRVQVVDDARGVGADDAVADRGEGHLRELLLLGEGLLGELALDLGGGAGGEDLEDGHRRQILRQRLGAHHRHVPEGPAAAVEERHADVALDAGLDDPAVLGEEAPDVRGVVAGLSSHHVLARRAAEVVLEGLAVAVDLPEGQEAHAGDGLVDHLGDEGVLHAEGLGQMAHEGAQEVRAGGRGGPLDDGPQPLLAQPALGDVHGAADDGGLAVVQHHHRRGQVEPPLAAVLGDDGRLIAVRHLLAAQPFRRPVAKEALRLRRGEVPGHPFEQLCRAVAGEGLARGVDVQEPVGPVDEDGRRGGLRQNAEPLVGLAHRQRGGFPLESGSDHGAHGIPKIQDRNLQVNGTFVPPKYREVQNTGLLGWSAREGAANAGPPSTALS